MLIDEASRIVGTGEWLEKYGRVCKEGRQGGIAAGKRRGGNTVMEEADECVMYIG